MGQQHDFPLDNLKSSLGKMQLSLEKAEVEFSAGKELVESIKEAKETISKVNKSLKFTQETS